MENRVGKPKLSLRPFETPMGRKYFRDGPSGKNAKRSRGEEIVLLFERNTPRPCRVAAMPEKRSSVYPPAPHPAPLSKVTPQRLKHSTPLHSTPRKSELIVSGFHSVTGRNYIAATNGDSVVYRNDFFTFRFPSGFRKRSTVNATART